MEKVEWKVEGMTCSNCALSVSKYLQKEGMKEVKVNPITGEVSFSHDGTVDDRSLSTGIEQLGYRIAGEDVADAKKPFLSTNKSRFLFTLPFTAVLMLHMLERWIPIHWLMNPWIQLSLCIPVFITGLWFFGRSAVKSIRNGIPNMNVLITIGAVASFAYSLTGAILGLGESYFFFETTASIITLVFLGNYLEDVAVQSTQKQIKKLARSQKVMANMIAFDDMHQEQIFPVDNSSLKEGDLVLIKTGEQVPADCKILWGDCMVNEAIITGESLPVEKTKKDKLIGGSILENGVVKAQVTAAGKNTVLSGILQMVQQAQAEKPPMQKMADRISAIFVPVVLVIAAITFLVNFFMLDITAGQALMRSVAVLVIACPCAMGLATPAAIAVGLGRGTKKGVLFRNAASLESFKSIKQVVFDKTGTLTTGDFKIADYHTSIDADEFKKIVFSLEKFSTHPLARSISKEWKSNDAIRWKKVEEVKGRGISATDDKGNVYEAGSYKILAENETDNDHNIFITINNKVIGWIDVQDEIREEAAGVVKWLKSKGIRPILLSGDRRSKCEIVANKIGIEEIYADRLPAEKLQIIEDLERIAPTAMVGDGINDAPSLAKATIGISLSDASQLAMQSADVILMNNGLKNLTLSLGLGKHTYITIKQNLFWAFIYNIVAIPVAAAGFLTPTVAALAMGFSDIVLAINSTRLFVKKVH